MGRISLCVVLSAVTLTAIGASLQVAPAATSYPVASAPEGFRDAIERGDAIVKAMQTALLAELTGEMQRGGPEGAIKACHLEAIGVGMQIGRKQGVAAGRTSHRLRNPTNAPRAWAAPIVASHAGKAIQGVDGFVVDLGDRIGLLRPIAHRAACAGCHGPRERLSRQVVKELKERYPGDQAVGFKEGDIRGWFWVEVPKTVPGT